MVQCWGMVCVLDASNLLVSGLQSITLMFPVTQFDFYAFILTLVLSSNDPNSIRTGIVSSVLLCPFNMFT